MKTKNVRAIRSELRGCGVGLALGAILVLVAPSSVFGEFSLFDDFEDEAIGPIGGQDGWSSGGGDNRVVVDPANPLNHVLYVPSASSVLRKTLLDAGLAIPDGTPRMMFMRMRVANKQTYSVGLSAYSSPSQYSDFAPEIGMANSAPNLDLRVWDDDGDNYQVLTQLTADTWYNMWVLVDTELDQYEIWLSSEGHAASPMDKLSAEGGDETFEFRSGSTNDLVTFYIKTSGGSSGFGPVYFDDIYIELTATQNLCNPVNPPDGDCDEDGVVDMNDVSPFLSVLLDPDMSPYDPHCADLNCDGLADGQDVQQFIEQLVL